MIFQRFHWGTGRKRIRRQRNKTIEFSSSLVFNFAKVTSGRRNRCSPSWRAGRGHVYFVAAGHCWPTDELSDNNWVKRGKQMMSWVHGLERTDWFIFPNNTCQSKSVLSGGGVELWFTTLCRCNAPPRRRTAPHTKSPFAMMRRRWWTHHRCWNQDVSIRMWKERMKRVHQ